MKQISMPSTKRSLIDCSWDIAIDSDLFFCVVLRMFYAILIKYIATLPNSHRSFDNEFRWYRNPGLSIFEYVHGPFCKRLIKQATFLKLMEFYLNKIYTEYQDSQNISFEALFSAAIHNWFSIKLEDFN